MLFYKKKSQIHGYGLFAKNIILENKIIGVAFYKTNNTKITDKDYKYTYIGRWVNHSINNNVNIKIQENQFYYYAIRNIYIDEEILMNYELVPFFEA
jgi:SET domain-containing protein